MAHHVWQLRVDVDNDQILNRSWPPASVAESRGRKPTKQLPHHVRQLRVDVRENGGRRIGAGEHLLGDGRQYTTNLVHPVLRLQLANEDLQQSKGPDSNEIRSSGVWR